MSTLSPRKPILGEKLIARKLQRHPAPAKYITRNVVVSKVGRKYFETKYEPDEWGKSYDHGRFLVETWSSACHNDSYNRPTQLFSNEQEMADYVEKFELASALGEHFRGWGDPWGKLSLEQLRAISVIVKS
jgi:hypothetical protein